MSRRILLEEGSAAVRAANDSASGLFSDAKALLSGPCAIELPSDRQDTRFVRLDNLGRIKAVYGETAWEIAQGALSRSAGSCRWSVSANDDRGSFALRPGPDAWPFDEMLASLAISPLEVEGERFHILPVEAIVVDGGGGRPFPQRAGDVIYRRDMQVAAAVMASLQAGEMRLAWQPVVASVSGADDTPAYYEALTRFDDFPVTSSVAIEALERTGMIRVVDRRNVLDVISQLENWPDVRLGVNVSPVSAAMDGWWDAIVTRLLANPEVARRLVIEITETAAFSPAVYRFAGTFRKLGCTIALDDFGAGYSSIANLIALSPDIVKIDRSMLRRASSDPVHRAAFLHVAGLAGALSEAIVIEGIENAEQAALVDDAAKAVSRSVPMWRQGYLYGTVFLLRPWCVAGGGGGHVSELSATPSVPFEARSGDDDPGSPAVEKAEAVSKPAKINRRSVSSSSGFGGNGVLLKTASAGGLIRGMIIGTPICFCLWALIIFAALRLMSNTK